MLTSLDHVVVAVNDLARATDTYRRLLGREISWRGEHPSFGTANVLFRLSNTYIELLAPTGEAALAARLRQHLQERGEGLFALAFGTADAVACAEALRQGGLGASAPVEGSGREAISGAERRWRNVFVDEDATRGVFLFAIEHLSPPESLRPAAPTGAESAAVTGLDHVVIMSPNADASAQLYGQRLGIRLALDRVFEARGVRLLFFRIGGVTVEIASSLAGGGAEDGDRLWGMSYKVAHVAAARQRVAEAGFDVSEVRPGHKPGTRVCTVRGETHGVQTLFIGPE